MLTTISLQSGPIHDVVKKGDIQEIQKLISENPSLLESKDRVGFTPLHIAAFYGQTEAAMLLINHKANLDSKNNNKNTPLHIAAMQNYPKVARLLISSEANLNSENNNGRTPLHIAAMRGHTELAKLIISFNADLNIVSSYGEKPFHLAKDQVSTILRSVDPYNHPDIIKTRRDNETILGQEALQNTLTKQKTTLPQHLLHREFGNLTNISSIRFGKKRHS